jgi:hypothetical protein
MDMCGSLQAKLTSGAPAVIILAMKNPDCTPEVTGRARLMGIAEPNLVKRIHARMQLWFSKTPGKSDEAPTPNEHGELAGVMEPVFGRLGFLSVQERPQLVHV